MDNLNRNIGLLTLRLILGFLIFFQGFGKIFKFGMENVHNNFFKSTYEDLLPSFVTHATAYYTSYVELIAGAMLIIGLKRDWALYAMASVLVIVTFGHGLAEPIWDTRHVLVRTILLVTILLLPKEWDRFSIDGLFLNKNKS